MVIYEAPLLTGNRDVKDVDNERVETLEVMVNHLSPCQSHGKRGRTMIGRSCPESNNGIMS